MLLILPNVVTIEIGLGLIENTHMSHIWAALGFKSDGTNGYLPLDRAVVQRNLLLIIQALRETAQQAPSAPPSPPTSPLQDGSDGGETVDTQEGEWQRQTWGFCQCTHCTKVIPVPDTWCYDCTQGAGLLCECAVCGECNCCCSCPADYPKRHCACFTCIQIVYGDDTHCDFCFEHDRDQCECQRCGRCTCCCDCEPLPDYVGTSYETLCDRCGNCDCCCNCEEWLNRFDNEGLRGTPSISSDDSYTCAFSEAQSGASSSQSPGNPFSFEYYVNDTAALELSILNHDIALAWTELNEAAAKAPSSSTYLEQPIKSTADDACVECEDSSLSRPKKRHVARGIAGMRNALLMLGASQASAANTQPPPADGEVANITIFVTLLLMFMGVAVIMLTYATRNNTATVKSNGERTYVEQPPTFVHSNVIALEDVPASSLNISNLAATEPELDDSSNSSMPDLVPAFSSDTSSEEVYDIPHELQRKLYWDLLPRCNCSNLVDLEHISGTEFDLADYASIDAKATESLSSHSSMPDLVSNTDSTLTEGWAAPGAFQFRLRGGGLTEPESPPSVIGKVATAISSHAVAPAQLNEQSTLLQCKEEPDSPPEALHTSSLGSSQSTSMSSQQYESPPHAAGASQESLREKRSPQPTSARQARRLAAVEQADHLVKDRSPYALSPNNPAALRSIVQEAAEIRDDGIPHGTRKADETGFNAVRRFAESIDTPHMRPRLGATVDVARELLFYALAIVGIAMAIKPGKHSAAKGMTTGKPSTALNYIYSFKRVMIDCGRWVPESMIGVLKQLKGLNARVRASFGQDCLIPHQTQPFSLQMLLKMAKALRQKTIKTWSNCIHTIMLVMICYCLATGTRCNEMGQAFQPSSLAPNPDTDYLRRSNFSPFKDGVELEATVESWASLINGDMIRAHPGPSKCDRDNVSFGNIKQWFRYDDTNPLNFAAVWAEWEINYPCPVDERDTWAAFSPDGDEHPFSCASLRALLTVLMLATIGAAETALRSWHAFRVTIACCLMARPEYRANPQAQEALIQMLVRWKTPESVRRYAKTLPCDYADHVDAVTRTDGHPLADMRHKVTIDPTACYEDIEAAIAELEAKLHHAKLAARKEPAESDSLIVPAEVTNSQGTADTEPSDEGPSQSEPEIYNCPSIGDVQVGDKDPRAAQRRAIGTSANVPNNIWKGYENDNGKTRCVIVGYSATTQIPEAEKKGAYVVETGGNYYAFDAAFHVFRRPKSARRT